MHISILLYLVLSLSAKASSDSKDFQQITKLMVENGCDEKNVQSERVRLSAKSDAALDMMVMCASDCGAQQCNYSIYLEEKGQYNYRGNFFGRYEIQKSKHASYFDLKIETNNPTGAVVSETLKLKGKTYQ